MTLLQISFGMENVIEFINELNTKINAPFVHANYFTLGREKNVSILVIISLDNKESWHNGYFENSRYLHFHINRNSIIECFAKSYKITEKFRKTKFKNFQDCINKINTYIAKVK